MIWFGTKDYATWVPAPSVANYASAATNWSSKVSFLNGGANVRRSFGSHREYAMTWNPKPQHMLSPISDFAHGLHGEDLIYWSDPFAEYTNIMPKDWATPVLGARGSVSVFGNQPPTAVPTSANTNGFPAFSAAITNVGNGNNKKTTILIPPGKDLIVRAYGSESGGLIRLIVRDRAGSSLQVPWGSVNDMNGTSPVRVEGGTDGNWVEVYFNSGSPGATAIISGVMAQIVDAGSTPLWERFISGQGNSGCRFDGTPATTPYSAALNLVGMTANLVEVGAWL